MGSQFKGWKLGCRVWNRIERPYHKCLSSLKMWLRAGESSKNWDYSLQARDQPRFDSWHHRVPREPSWEMALSTSKSGPKTTTTKLWLRYCKLGQFKIIREWPYSVFYSQLVLDYNKVMKAISQIQRKYLEPVFCFGSVFVFFHFCSFCNWHEWPIIVHQHYIWHLIHFLPSSQLHYRLVPLCYHLSDMDI